MPELKDIARLVAHRWQSLSLWQRTLSVFKGVQFTIWAGVLVWVNWYLISQMSGHYVVPLGWALWFILFWASIGATIVEIETVAAIVAKVTGISGRQSLKTSVVNDFSSLGENVMNTGAYVLVGLGIPVVVGVLNIFILHSVGGGGLTRAQIDSMVPAIAVLVILVAFVQIAILMALLTPVPKYIKKDARKIQRWMEDDGMSHRAWSFSVGLATVLTVIILVVTKYA